LFCNKYIWFTGVYLNNYATNQQTGKKHFLCFCEYLKTWQWSFVAVKVKFLAQNFIILYWWRSIFKGNYFNRNSMLDKNICITL